MAARRRRVTAEGLGSVTLLDSNVVLRYLLDDIPERSRKAATLIENSSVHIPHEVAAEVVYVLSSVYEAPRNDIALALKRLFSSNNVRTGNRNVLHTAIERFAESNLDFVDCLMYGYAAHGAAVVTFDRKLAEAIETLRD